MRLEASRSNQRLLVIADDPSVRERFAQMLAPQDPASATLWASCGEEPPQSLPFQVDYACAGVDAERKVKDAAASGTPYAMAYIEAPMPPGMDLCDAIERLWNEDRDLQTMIATDLKETGFTELRSRLSKRENFLVMRKPLDPIVVLQIAESRTHSWELRRAVAEHVLTLEDQVEERTARLEAEMGARNKAEARLRHLQKLEALGTLASGIAHELNNPLTVITENLKFFKSEMTNLLPHASKETADDLGSLTVDCLNSADRMVAIVRDMQRLGLPEKDARMMVGAKEAIESAVNLMATRLRRVEVVREYEDTPSIFANESQLIHVLTHLISNAVLALPDNGARKVTLQTRTTPAGNVRLIIADNGSGMSREQLEHAFEPFYTTRKLGQGVGLGLSTCHAIADFLGGTLTLDSEPWKGTRATLTLPGFQQAPSSQDSAA